MGEWDLVVRKDNGRREKGGKNNVCRRSRMPIVFLCLCDRGEQLRGAGHKSKTIRAESFIVLDRKSILI